MTISHDNILIVAIRMFLLFLIEGWLIEELSAVESVNPLSLIAL